MANAQLKKKTLPMNCRTPLFAVVVCIPELICTKRSGSSTQFAVECSGWFCDFQYSIVRIV